MRIKCPNCGSTAQVTCMWNDGSAYNTEQVKEYLCGCGCEFEATFKLDAINILNEGE